MVSYIDDTVGFLDFQSANQIGCYRVVIQARQVGGAASGVHENGIGELVKCAEGAGLIADGAGEGNVAGVGGTKP